MPDVEGRPALEAALAPLQEALYRLHEHDLEEQRVPLGPRDTSERRSGSAVGDQADDPYARFLRGLFQPAGSEPPLAADELPAAQLELLCAADPADEARAVAGAVRACLDQGIAPSAIAVIAGSAARRARLCEALQRLGVPACLLPPLAPTERRESVAQSPPLQALLGLYGLHHSGVPREALIRHLTSVYLRFFPAPPEGLPPWRVARALREAGIRDLGERPRRGAASEPRPPGEEPDHRRRLREWLRERQREARSRRPVDDAGANDALVALGELNLPERRVLPLLDNALRLLSTLPERATLAGHCAALRRLCERLSFSECVRAGEGGLDAIRARDEDAEGALLYLLEELPGAARRLSREQEPYERAAFAELLQELLQQLPVHSAESALARQGTAVQIGDLGRLCGRRHARLFITGLCEGELPGRAQEDALLGDDERRGLNRLLGGDFFPLSSAGCAAAPLWFACALAHADAATLSYPAVDEDGRPVLRSALFDEAQRAAARPEPPRRPREPVPRAGRRAQPRRAVDPRHPGGPRQPGRPGRPPPGRAPCRRPPRPRRPRLAQRAGGPRARPRRPHPAAHRHRARARPLLHRAERAARGRHRGRRSRRGRRPLRGPPARQRPDRDPAAQAPRQPAARALRVSAGGLRQVPLPLLPAPRAQGRADAVGRRRSGPHGRRAPAPRRAGALLQGAPERRPAAAARGGTTTAARWTWPSAPCWRAGRRTSAPATRRSSRCACAACATICTA